MTPEQRKRLNNAQAKRVKNRMAMDALALGSLLAVWDAKPWALSEYEFAERIGALLLRPCHRLISPWWAP